MNKPNTSAFFKSIRMNAGKHSPEILMGLGIAGVITTTVLAVKATPKAAEICKGLKENSEEEPTKIDYIKATWKLYIPTAVSCAFTIACLVGVNSVNVKRNAALATAYQLSTTALSEYKDKVIETIGEKKEREVRDKVAKDKVNKNQASKATVVVTGKGDSLCFDVISGRYFKSDIEKIRKIENDLNRQMLTEMYISLNEFYDELGLDHISIGDELGWNVDNGLIELNFSSQISDDGQPCIVVDYKIGPTYNYSTLA